MQPVLDIYPYKSGIDHFLIDLGSSRALLEVHCQHARACAENGSVLASSLVLHGLLVEADAGELRGEGKKSKQELPHTPCSRG